MAKHTFRRKDIILFLLLAAILHILLTHLVTVRIRNMTGIHVSETLPGFLVNSNVPDRKGKDLTDEIIEDAKVYRDILFFLSLPFDPVLRPVHKKWAFRPYQQRKIDREEYRLRAGLIGIASKILNSLVFSLLAYWILIITVRQREKAAYTKNPD
jgi:hypothetical protein